MSDIEIIIRLTAVAVLTSYLLIKHCHRTRQRYERYHSQGAAGKAIDATQLTPAIAAIRRNYLANRRPASGASFHTALLGLARRAVARLAYFHDKESEEHPQTHIL